MADYDAGDVTDRERLAAERQKEIARQEADDVINQLVEQHVNYDRANQQNAKLRDVQLKQNARKSEADRFAAQRNLQNAALGLFGSMNQAMNGSTVGNMLSMLSNRNDADNSTYWQQLTDNQNAVRNAYEEAYNQNQIAKNDARINAEKAIRDIESSLSTNLANINPNLYSAPGRGDARLYSERAVQEWEPVNNPQLSGYVMPSNAEQAVIPQRNTIKRNDYFGNLLNKFNGR